MNKKKIANLAPYGYITPITVILIGFVIVSVIISIVLSFTRYNIMTPPTFYGLKNYERLVTDTKFMKALFNTLKLMVMIVPLQMILSLIVSVFLVSHRHMLIGKIANSVIFITLFQCGNRCYLERIAERKNSGSRNIFWLVWDQGIYVAWKC